MRNCKICLEPLHCDCLCLTCQMAREQAIGKSKQMSEFAAENDLPVIIVRRTNT